MSGHVERRGKSLRLVVDVGRDPVTGRRRQIKQTVPPGPDGKPVGPREANRLLNDLIAKHAGRATDRSQATLLELLDAYHEARTRMSPGTREGDAGYIRRNVTEHLKTTPIGRIGAYELDALYRHLEARGGTCRLKTKCETTPCDHGGGAPLSASTVGRVHDILSAAFGQAVKWGWLRENPCEKATPPLVVRDEVEPPDVETVVKLLAHIDVLPPLHPLRDFVALILATGARPAELCALPWRNVDFDLGRIKIAQAFSRGDKGTIKSTKTNKTRRPRLDESTLVMLRARHREAAKVALNGGVPLEQAYVFPSTVDATRPVWPTTMGSWFREARAEVGAGEELTLKNLRHFVASTLLAHGTDVVTVAKRLGHSPQVLLNIYAHVIDEADDAAAGVVAATITALRELSVDGTHPSGVALGNDAARSGDHGV